MLDFSTLLQPISKEAPSGANLREDISSNSLYYQIKDARTAARTAERNQTQGIEPNDAKTHWRIVYKLGIDILASHSKDLDITAWLIEALVREHGFAGLRDGFHLTKELISQYWDTLYPEPDEEEGIIAKIAPLMGLNGSEVDGTLIVPIASVCITEGTTAGPFNFWQYQQAQKVDLLADPNKREQRIASGAISIKEFKTAVNETSKIFFETLLGDLQSCINEFTLLTNMLDKKCGENAPPSSSIRNKLTKCLTCARIISKDILDKITESNPEITNNLTDQQSATDAIHFSNDNNTLANRTLALQTLLQIAKFFRQTEPHSPIPYLLERTVKWGKMSLHDLLNELIADEKAREQVCDLTGITKRGNENG